MVEQHHNIPGSLDGESPLDCPHAVTPTTNRMTRDPGSAPDLSRVLIGITTAVCAAVPGADFASITRYREPRKFLPDATTHAIANELEKFQAQLRQGPGAEAVHGSDTVYVRAMDDEHRWPIFALRASALGVGSMVSFRLFVQEHSPLGALNLYAARTRAFTADDKVIGAVFATQAANALNSAIQHAQLREALVSRDPHGVDWSQLLPAQFAAQP